MEFRAERGVVLAVHAIEGAAFPSRLLQRALCVPLWEHGGHPSACKVQGGFMEKTTFGFERQKEFPQTREEVK